MKNAAVLAGSLRKGKDKLLSCEMRRSHVDSVFTVNAPNGSASAWAGNRNVSYFKK